VLNKFIAHTNLSTIDSTMQKKSNLKEIITVTAGLGALGVGLYYFFVRSKNKALTKKLKPLDLPGIPTNSLEDFQKAILNLRFREENGHIATDCLIKILSLMETFLRPFLKEQCYSSRQSRRNYLQDIEKYLEVVKLHHDMVKAIWTSTAHYIGGLLDIDGRRIIDDCYHYYNTEAHFRFFLLNFPHNFELEFPPKQKINKDMYMQIHNDMMQMLVEEGELLKANTALLKSHGHGVLAVLLVRVLDRVYVQYGYEHEDIYSIFGGFLKLITGQDNECVETCANFNSKLVDISDQVVLSMNATVRK